MALPSGYQETPDYTISDSGSFTGYCSANAVVQNEAACTSLGSYFAWVGNFHCGDLNISTQAACTGGNRTWINNGSTCTGAGGDSNTCSKALVISSTMHNQYVNCGGAGFASIELAIADCASKNGVLATWDGATLGVHSEGKWKMVARRAGNKEVWRDERTGLVWSSGTYRDGKEGMGKNSTPSVRWRLPGVYDYRRADIDGIRMVMPDMNFTATAGSEWTSTYVASTRSQALSFGNVSGTVANYSRSTLYAIRCVGR